MDKKLVMNLVNGYSYILVKNNATIGVLSLILDRRLKGERYYHKIEDFIGNDSCVNINMNKEMVL